ncbi:hypothetical protein ACX8XP_05315 [Calditrichota bacterium LG25]
MSRLRIVITDSGLGGLDVAARFFAALRSMEARPNVDLLFVNALPEAQKGYNKMSDKAEKIRMFNQVLHGIQKHYSPHIIAIVCNTLSVIVSETDFYKQYAQRIMNIVEIFAADFLNKMKNIKNTSAIIFATETTIKNANYQNLLFRAGFQNNCVIPISCYKLASEIELDSQSRNTSMLVKKYVAQAVDRAITEKKKFVVILGCTHYGYVRHLFARYFSEIGLNNIKFFNPNRSLVEALLKKIATVQQEPAAPLQRAHHTFRVISKAQILPSEVKSIAALIEPISAEAAAALQQYELKKDLF